MDPRGVRQKPFQRAIKRVIDVVASAVGLVALSPAFAFGAILVKSQDGGPVFFRQERVGRGGRLFRVWKFRSMVTDADRLLDEQGRVGNVDRLTRVGRILRGLSLDELPQLINVFKGEMSLVGPRPVLSQHLARYGERQKQRLRMKPGITGLAQVSGRNTLKWSRRIEYDLWYIDNFSLWQDIQILARTFKVIASREGIVLDRNPEEVDDLAPAGSEGEGLTGAAGSEGGTRRT